MRPVSPARGSIAREEMGCQAGRVIKLDQLYCEVTVRRCKARTGDVARRAHGGRAVLAVAFLVTVDCRREFTD